MTAESPTLFALYKYEYDDHIRDVFFKRRIAHEYLNHFLVIREPDNWVAFYGYLCEYIGILYHFEEALEKIRLTADWDEEKEYWLMDEKLATALMMFLTCEMICREDLLQQNVSFSKH